MDGDEKTVLMQVDSVLCCIVYIHDAVTAAAVAVSVSALLSRTVDVLHTRRRIYRRPVSINLNHLHYHINVGRISAEVT